MFRKYALAALLALFVPALASAQVSEIGKPVKVVTNADIVGYTDWSADTVYQMSGLIYVEAGDTLMIEPGTIIKGEDGQGAASTALVVTRDGYIIAQGTPGEPIIFTSIYDDVDDPFDIPLGDPGRGLWGGVIMLGKAGINTTTGEGQIEGIDPLEPRARYGGTDDAHSSGIFSYVSIRHGGTDIGDGNEINGLTMGAVGSGTKIDHVEVFENKDDGYEWFGGTVDAKHLISAFNGDDGFDVDEGYRGRLQYLLVLQNTDAANRCSEMDGGTTPEDGTPYATVKIANATYIGAGDLAAADNDLCIIMRDNNAGSYYNSIFVDQKDHALQIEDLADPLLEDSRARLEEGTIQFKDNIWYGFDTRPWVSPSVDANSAISQQFVWDLLMDPGLGYNNDNVDPQINQIDRTQSQIFDPSPATGSPAASGATALADPWFDAVSYKGAFPPNDYSWLQKWTFLDFGQFLKPTTTDNGKPVVVVTNASIVGRTVWTNDNVYQLSGLVYVEDGDTLVIEPGTVIKGEDGQGAASSALVVTRDGYIIAQGTASQPIIFTSIYDDVTDPYDIPLGDAGRGLWGGVIMLGNATINTTTGVGQIEGIDPLEPRARYGGGDLVGGPDDDDNRGIFQYVSIRHGGTDIGDGNEINGLTMGAVGRGTTIDHIEVFSNKDDGYEWFGGTVDVKYLISAFNGDDGFDTDEGYHGRLQFLIVVQGDDAANRCAEEDGGTTPEDGTPLSQPVFYNVTYIGAGAGAVADNDLAIMIRDNGAPSYYNSIFADCKERGIEVEDLADPLLEDSRKRLEAGDFDFQNNIWWNFGAGGSLSDFITQDFVRNILFTPAKHNDLVNPALASIDRGQNGLLDLRPDPNGYATQNVRTPTDPWFDAVPYKGAVDPYALKDSYTMWMNYWSFLYSGGFMGTVPNAGCCVLRGNVDGAGDINVSDLTYLVTYLFQGGANPACLEEADIDGSTAINISDLTYLVAYLFQGGADPIVCP